MDIKKISIIALIILVIATMVGLFWPERNPEEIKREKLCDVIATQYTLYVSEETQMEKSVAAETSYRTLMKEDGKAVFLASQECKKGLWSTTFSLNLQTMKGTLWEEYAGKCKFAEVNCLPGPYGEFRLTIKYEDGEVMFGRFVPILFVEQKEAHVGLIRSLFKGLF